MSKAAKAKRAARKAEAEKLERRARLDREIKFSNLNSETNRRLWREMLLRVKIPEIRQRVEIGWQTFERALDFKDYRIDFLLDAIWEAEEQYALSVKCHAEIIDRLLRVYEKRLQGGFQEFHGSAEVALQEKKVETERIIRENNEAELLLKKIGFVVNRRIEDSASNARSNAISKVDAFVEDAKNERSLATTRLENRLRDLSNDLRVILSNYRAATADRRKECESIGKKDEEERHSISQHWARADSLLQNIEKFREKIANYEVYKTERLRQITIECQFFRNAYLEEKTRFTSETNRDKKNTAIMSIQYNKSAKKLNAIIKKGERILTLMRMCGKYETQDEKVIAFHNGVPFEDHEINFKMNISAISPILGEDFHYITMSGFWHKVGASQLIAAELRRERDQLLSAIETLKRELKRRLEESKDE